MSVYSELVKIGMNEKEASKLNDVVNIHDNLVTKDYLDAKLHALEVRLLLVLIATMFSMTGLFAYLVNK